MQFMTLDSVAAVYRPLITSNGWLIIYFLVFLLLGPVALMNIVTAIMVESSLRTANEDQEAKKVWEQMRRKNMMPKLRQMFIDLDTSGDGEVDLEEVMNAPVSLKEAMQHMIGLDQLEEIFNLLDFDGSGSVDIEEFLQVSDISSRNTVASFGGSILANFAMCLRGAPVCAALIFPAQCESKDRIVNHISPPSLWLADTVFSPRHLYCVVARQFRSHAVRQPCPYFGPSIFERSDSDMDCMRTAAPDSLGFRCLK